MTLKIAILGAGPVGLTLAAILHHRGLAFDIFDRDDPDSARSQGGTLDLHPDGGQKALRAAGLLGVFLKVARRDGEAIRLLNGGGEVIFEGDGLPGPGEVLEDKIESGDDDEQQEAEEAHGRPEIDRAALKQLLLDALPQGTVRWNWHVDSITPSASGPGTWTVGFDTQPSSPAAARQDYDLVVGADGAWSKVRSSCLSSAEPHFSGITALDVWISDLDRDPDTAAVVGQGSCFAFDPDRALLFQRHGDGSARCYACVRTGEVGSAPLDPGQALGRGSETQGEVDWLVPANREAFLRKWFGGFAPELTRAVLSMRDRALLRHLYMLPVGFRWESRPGVTLVGDAAHLMTPFAGRGVNVGMVDAVELAEGIVGFVRGNGRTLDDVVREYENRMFERSVVDARLTERCMLASFGEDGARAVGEIMSQL
ncbi:hypothetical protein TruAng_005792 [Truncatella angustata]|nr:hypothetical protein TruAng_005792 [Truncatella angustata]